MQFKTEDLRRQWSEADLDPRLRDLVEFVDLDLRRTEEREAVVTSLIRTDNPSSVHAYGRGADIRTRDWPAGLPEGLAHKINVLFVYDPERPEKQCALVHNVGQGTHLHLQVHPRSAWLKSTDEVVG